MQIPDADSATPRASCESIRAGDRQRVHGSALRLPLFLKQRDCEALWERALGKTAARLDEEDRVVAKAEIKLQVTSLSNIFEQMSRGESESDAVLLVSSEAGSSIQTR